MVGSPARSRRNTYWNHVHWRWMRMPLLPQEKSTSRYSFGTGSHWQVWLLINRNIRRPNTGGVETSSKIYVVMGWVFSTQLVVTNLLSSLKLCHKDVCLLFLCIFHWKPVSSNRSQKYYALDLRHLEILFNGSIINCTCITSLIAWYPLHHFAEY